MTHIKDTRLEIDNMQHPALLFRQPLDDSPGNLGSFLRQQCFQLLAGGQAVTGIFLLDVPGITQVLEHVDQGDEPALGQPAEIAAVPFRQMNPGQQRGGERCDFPAV